ncbi:MAG: stage II sporulation protein M [Proteobacteria bacterium]|nr:stage II sporulation protein M [Pseudomonadota bacterium]
MPRNQGAAAHRATYILRIARRFSTLPAVSSPQGCRPSTVNPEQVSTTEPEPPPSAQVLERYLSRLNASGLKSLSGRELLDLGRAWRRCGALLSRARSAGLEGPNFEALNRLLARVYPLVQRPVERRSSSAFDLIARDFPRAVRREVRVIALATIVLLIGALVGAAVAALNHDMTDVVLGSGWADALDKVATRHVGDADWMPVETRPFESARIMTNNLRVAITAFGLGVILCLGSFWVLYFNGLMLGAVAIVVHQRGVDAPFWGFVAPHGPQRSPPSSSPPRRASSWVTHSSRLGGPLDRAASSRRRSAPSRWSWGSHCFSWRQASSRASSRLASTSLPPRR